MILDISVYFAVFAVSVMMASLYQKTINSVHIKGGFSYRKFAGPALYCIVGCVLLLPIIAMFGLRYGIGRDYYVYERIYNTLHNAGFSEYWFRHINSVGSYYVELGYYVLNRIFPNYRMLLWGLGILIFVLFLLAVKNYSKRLSFSFALFVFLSTQFVYSLNGTRFTVALGFILLAYIALAEEKAAKFILLILLAALFHKSSLFCLAIIFLIRYKYKGINSIRNIVLFTLILSFPFISAYLLQIAGNLSLFSRYFSTTRYTASETMSSGWTWLLHVLPVYLPLIIFCKKEVFDSEDTKTLFRICIMEIPFRMLGLYNTWYTRFARCSQIAQVIFIPLILEKITNKQKKIVLHIYYIVWFIFYFSYYAIINDQGDSLPYVWIFSR